MKYLNTFESFLTDINSDDFLYSDEVGEETGENGPYVYAVIEDKFTGSHFKVKWNKLPENVVNIENINNNRNVGYGANVKAILDEEEIEIDSNYTEDFTNALEQGDIDAIWLLSSEVLDKFYK